MSTATERVMAEQWPAPVLGKRQTPPGAPDERREHVPLTWDFFLHLRAWARWTARHTGSHAYLVGSALTMDAPRDVDVAFVWPRLVYERHFGPTPRADADHAARWRTDFQYARHAFTVEAWLSVGYKPYIDIHLCPDVWHRNSPRLLLGTPDDPGAPSGWSGQEFGLRSITQQDGRVVFEWREGLCWDER